ncbi:putative mitochondrial protein AtMg00860 [Tasmannia lanceolata]|uniref:putative mitochondrial protein AtMg00860 n=1 Tax=Tasmannia lanceolata TaxID=3420 RepID=UPI0040640F13
MSPKEHEELRRQVEELLEKGFIRESTSPCAVPALPVPKKDGTWRICIDSRAIDRITVKYRFPIPRLDDMLDQLTRICIAIWQHLRQVFEALGRHHLFANTKKCKFCTNHLIFLGYEVSNEGLKPDESKVQAIMEWSTPRTIRDVRAFHGLASFYCRFIRGFSALMAPVTDCLKKGEFKWSKEAQESLEAIKES